MIPKTREGESISCGKVDKSIKMKPFLHTLRAKLAQLSFRTGLIVLLCCVPFYILSFAQMALDIDVRWKGALWVLFFGLAKAFQYTGIAILGVEGYRKVKQRWRSAWRSKS